ncbi:MAG TPA: branched-chain amino acid ABC transporter permease [Acidimicrobiia bacterium]|nr:branched-chain amino acid ABC transporter permease [Acidimicrobiia bacterium]
MAILVVVVTFLGTRGPGSLDRTVTTMVVNLILVVGTYSFIGLSGVFSFGHMAFTVVGAYTFAFLAIPLETKAITMPNLPAFLASAQMPPVPATLMAGLAAAVLALVVAVPLTRMTGLSAALGTFAVLIIVNQVARNWQDLTNGTAGVPAIPTTTTPQNAVIWALVMVSLVFLLQQSRFGLRLRASREDDVAARALAIHIPILRGAALVLSAFICGVAGALSAALLGAFGPGTYFLELNFLILVMLVIGGIKSLSGAVVGTIVVAATSELLRRVEQGVELGSFSFSGRPGLREVGLAVILLLILILRPTGIMGARELTWPFRRTPTVRPGDRSMPASGDSE